MTKAPAPRPARTDRAPAAAARHYAVCGLVLASDAPIAGLDASPGIPDVHVAWHDARPIPPLHPSDRAWYQSPYIDAAGRPVLVASARAVDGSRWLRYSEGAAFRIDAAGARLDVWWQPPLTALDAATYVLGPVLAFLLRMRGRVPLHASGVAVDGHAMLFAGDAGAGKSTTAAALAALGCPLLSDDVVPLADGGGGLSAWPGYPRVSLCADAAQALFAQQGALPAYSDSYPKQYLDLDAAGLAFQRAPLPVGQLFVLAGQTAGREPAIRSLGPRESLVALLRHTYGTYLIDIGMRAREFDVLARLVETVPVHEVRFAAGLDTLGTQCAALLERFRQRA
jgi:hypothetical protein